MLRKENEYVGNGNDDVHIASTCLEVYPIE
jgi:hypothetical protein